MTAQEPSHVAVAVAATPGLDLAERLGDAIGGAGGAPGPATVLSDGPGQFAVERVFSGDPKLVRVRLAKDDASIDAAVTPLQNRRKRVLICDMDSTIIGQECLDELADFAGLKAEIAAITERAMRGELNFEEALKTRVAMLKGLSVDAIERCYAERIRLNPGARELVAAMAANGARCLLVSGGFTAFTARVAEAAGFHSHHANTLLDDGAALTGAVAEPILGREAKLATLQTEAARLGLTPADALALGDGANDLAMIEAAGLGVAYRAKPVVAAAADAAITHADLTAALYFQGYSAVEIRSSRPA